ncbi:hypothetical protein ACVWW1_000588 [Bradyrhizobium sp. JR3.5]
MSTIPLQELRRRLVRAMAELPSNASLEEDPLSPDVMRSVGDVSASLSATGNVMFMGESQVAINGLNNSKTRVANFHKLRMILQKALSETEPDIDLTSTAAHTRPTHSGNPWHVQLPPFQQLAVYPGTIRKTVPEYLSSGHGNRPKTPPNPAGDRPESCRQNPTVPCRAWRNQTGRDCRGYEALAPRAYAQRRSAAACGCPRTVRADAMTKDAFDRWREAPGESI